LYGGSGPYEPKKRVQSKVTEEFGSGLNLRWVPVKSKLELMRILMGVRAEETAFTSELTERRHFRDHSSRWLKAFWTVRASFNGSG